MAWNDPFETLVDSLVDELGIYLQENENLDEMTIVQTQEVCRDFCDFLCKDVRKATPRDYTVYTQLHAFTPEEEQDYALKLGYIKAFCESCPKEHGDSSTQVNVNEKQVKPSVSLKERALMRERRATQSFDAESFRIDELMMMDNPEDLDINEIATRNAPTPMPKQTSGLIPTGKVVPHSRDLSKQELEKAARATPQKALKAVSNEEQNELTMPGFSDTKLNKVSVGDSLDDIVSAAKARSNQASAKKELETYEDTNEDSDIGQFKISPNESFAIPVNSGLFQRVSHEYEEQRNQKTEDSRTDEKSNDQDSADFIRGVDGVDYDFSSQQIRKMREFEKKQAKNIQPEDSGEALHDSFRPYLFDSKYFIDIPLPNVEDMVPVKLSPVNRYLFPLAPAIVIWAVSLFMFTISAIVGLIFFLIGCACFAAVLADIKPSPQQTPQATLISYLNARQGRCYGCGMSLLALPKLKLSLSDDLQQAWGEFNDRYRVQWSSQWSGLHDAWRPENNWPTAILKRFQTVQPPETRQVIISPKQDALILFYSVGETYYLVPMVQIDGKWYRTNPKSPPHEMA